MSIFTAFFLSFWLGCTTQPIAPTKQSIFDNPDYITLLTAIDQRDVVAVIPFLKSRDYELRLFAFQQCASLNDTSLYPLLFSALNDTTEIRLAAAFALGQQGDTSLYNTLNISYQTENDIMVKGALLQAMAKNLPLAEQTNLLNTINAAPCEIAPLWAAFRALQSGLKDTSLIDKALSDLFCTNKDARLAAANYLSRAPGIDLTQSFHSLVKSYQNEDDIDIKIALAGSFKKSNHPETGNWVMSELQHIELDERIAANLLRGAQQQGWVTGNALMSLCRDPRPHIASMAANSIFAVELNTDSLKMLATSENITVAISATSKLPINDGEIARIIQAQPDPYQQVLAIRSLVKTNLEKDFLESLLTSQQAPVRTSALETLLTYSNPDIQKYLSLAAEQREEGQLAILGTYISEHPEQADEETSLLLEQMTKVCILPRMVETYNALIDGINATRDTTLEHYTFLGKNVPEYKLLSRFNDTIAVFIHTTKGIINLELYPRVAPGTVSSFIKLVDGGFYDQKRFHRVVPNFVIQGGCPRGDGWGSSDDVIRSEFSAESYTTGAMGMASAGKDTESCQWFITHSPTPHLDGRYTLFGRVTAGMDVVRKITEGDTIEKILF